MGLKINTPENTCDDDRWYENCLEVLRHSILLYCTALSGIFDNLFFFRSHTFVAMLISHRKKRKKCPSTVIEYLQHGGESTVYHGKVKVSLTPLL